jgi:hypothetical protein
MSGSYRDAAEALYRAPHEAWVTERKRLAAELRAAGDKAGASQLAKLPRPPLSAWVVNQLWWRAPDVFAQLLAAAARSRAGDFAAAAAARRDAVAVLKARAAGLLVEAGHAAGEATLRRVTTTLSALAAAGGFEPDLPGMLGGDRDPPGFDAPGLAEALALGASPAAPSVSGQEGPGEAAPQAVSSVPSAPAPAEMRAAAPFESGSAEREAAREAAEREAAREAAEREAAREAAEREAQRAARARAEEAEREARRERERLRRERERELRRAERERIESSLVTLRADLERRRREVERLRNELARVEGLAHEAQAAIARAEGELVALGPSDAEPP